eukprot:TRINITY_DN14413_c0_g4_i1.p2 TRINITY_DN14413_c0_g4~~TRINITY_DN14413_c0_g4_i1.p2  ORF type:complete len:326 (-),score=26.71 TRINITY_DN14413_c0_g4_i1:158-1135(-)
MPKASIIIPAFNAEAYIRETIESILSQSYTDYEVIVVDDGSTDRTADVVKSFSDDRIRYFHQHNSGKPSVPRNYAIRQSRGDYIFVFDSDDIMLPGKLERTVNVLDEAPSAGLAFTDFACIDEAGSVINESFLANNRTLHNLPKTPAPHGALLIDQEVALKGLVKSNFPGTSGVALRREITEKVGHFNESVKNADDAIMWQAVASQYDFAFIPEVFHHYRIRSGSISLRKIEERAQGIVGALETMKQFHQGDKAALKALDEKIARCYFDAGYSCFSQYKFADARAFLKNSLRIDPQFRTLKYLLASYCPKQVVSLLKTVKHAASF